MRRLLTTFILLMIGGLVFYGCQSHEVEGPDPVNQPPVVQFVNIPVEGAKFSSDTAINWYGTDVDGFITHFRYAVIVDSFVIQAGGPAAYIESTPDDQIDWINLEVSLDDPQTSDRVQMSADVSDPVRSYVTSYIFLQAIDNLGAKSQVVWRHFQKNDHFPNTVIASSVRGTLDPYVNAVSGAGILAGVHLEWGAVDPIDYPRNPPPFEYKWKMWGPYDSLEVEYIDSAYVGSVFVDNFGDFYYPGDSLPSEFDVDTTIDTTVSPPETTIVVDTTFLAVNGLPANNPYGSWNEKIYLDTLDAGDAHFRPVDSSIDALTGGRWVYDEETSIFDVYRNYSNPADTTVRHFFLFELQARDDAKVPDPIPAFKWISVIDPKHERDIIVIDVTAYKNPDFNFWNWPVFPTSPYNVDTTKPLVREKIAEWVDNWGGAEFDNDNVLSDKEYTLEDGRTGRIPFSRYKATQDYYPVVMVERAAITELGIGSVNLREILKHKIIIVVKDNAGSGNLIMTSPEMLAVVDGIDAGMSCWSILRAPFQSFYQTSIPEMTSIPTSYEAHFGIEGMVHTAWWGNVTDAGPLGYDMKRTEDFIGAWALGSEDNDWPNSDNLPYLPIDLELLPTNYYWYWFANLWPPDAYPLHFPYYINGTDEPIIGAYPEVGYVQRSPLTEPLYLYHSKYGQRTPRLVDSVGIKVGNIAKFEGGVVAVAYETPLFKTSHFSFNMLAMDQDSAQVVFNNMMDWLSDQTYIQSGKLNHAAQAPLDVQKLRRISNELHEMKAKGLLQSVSGE